MKTNIAYFISSHGYGHAARSAAIMESLNAINKDIVFNIFTRIPKWFFTNSQIENFESHDVLTDIGLVQITALKEDIYQTITELNSYYPLQDALIDKYSKIIERLEYKLVICDISPLGLAVAINTGIKSVLVENFTWDWIYDNYNLNDKNLNKHIKYLKSIYSSATYRLKTEPFCYQSYYDIKTFPVSRKPRSSKIEIRKRLKVDENKPLILITMGGINSGYSFPEILLKLGEINFVLPGISEKFTTRNNITLIPRISDFSHPDLVNSSDAVFGKLGYSTLAEAYNAGKPYGYITRDVFPESIPLEHFIRKNMKGIKITADKFDSNNWLSELEELLSLTGSHHNHENGADQAARFINNLII